MFENAFLEFLAAFGFGYLVGAVPFGLVLTRAAGLSDIRKIGSGNIGATNVLRTGRKGLAAATLGLDIAKGAAAVLLAGLVSPLAGLWAGGGAVIGHLYPLWLRFRGGKGVATFLGVAGGISPLTGAIAAASWLVVAAVFRISSLAGLVMVAATPVGAWQLGMKPAAALLAAVAGLIFWKHRENITRLLSAAEPRIGQSKK